MSKPKEKISDHLAAGRFPFVPPIPREQAKTLADMFPSITDLEITVQEEGDPIEKFRPLYLGLQDNLQPIDCSDPRCKGGGFLFFGEALRKAVAEGKTDFFEGHRCRGVTRQRPRVVQCSHRFIVTGKFRYKEPHEKPLK